MKWWKVKRCSRDYEGVDRTLTFSPPSAVAIHNFFPLRPKRGDKSECLTLIGTHTTKSVHDTRSLVREPETNRCFWLFLVFGFFKKK